MMELYNKRRLMLCLLCVLAYAFSGRICAEKFVPAEFPVQKSAWTKRAWGSHKYTRSAVLDEAQNRWHLFYGWKDINHVIVDGVSFDNNLSGAKSGPSNPVVQYTEGGHDPGTWGFCVGKNPDGTLADDNGKVVIAYSFNVTRRPFWSSAINFANWQSHNEIGKVGGRHIVNSLLRTEDGTWRLFYSTVNPRVCGMASGKSLGSLEDNGTVLEPTLAWERHPKWDHSVHQPVVLRDSKSWIMVYTGHFETGVGLARSNDLQKWEKKGEFMGADDNFFHFYDVAPIIDYAKKEVTWRLFFDVKKESWKLYVAEATVPLDGNTVAVEKPITSRKMDSRFSVPANAIQFTFDMHGRKLKAGTHSAKGIQLHLNRNKIFIKANGIYE